jgi:hypothetical protein
MSRRVASGEDRGDEREDLVAGVRPARCVAQVDVLVNRAIVVEGGVEAVLRSHQSGV